MKKLIRVVTATLLLAACVAAAAPGTTGTLVLQEGPSPVPLCDPTKNPKCPMPVAPSAAPAHR